MTEWEPATDAEVAMRNALRTDDQESYFRILAGVDLLLPVSADALAGLAPLGWGTWSTGGRTHVLAFTSPSALQACLADYTGSARRVAYAELADTWPNLEWWLAVNPGLPIEGYLPAWFVAQLARGDLRLPTRGPARDGGGVKAAQSPQELQAAAMAANAAAGGYGAGGPVAPQEADRPAAADDPRGVPAPASAQGGVPAPTGGADRPGRGTPGPVGPGGLPVRTPGAVLPSGLPSRVPQASTTDSHSTLPSGYRSSDGPPGSFSAIPSFSGFSPAGGDAAPDEPAGGRGVPSAPPYGSSVSDGPVQTTPSGLPRRNAGPPPGDTPGPGNRSGATAVSRSSVMGGTPGRPADSSAASGAPPVRDVQSPDGPLPTRTPMAQVPPVPSHLAGPATADESSAGPDPQRPGGSDLSGAGGALPRRQVTPPSERPSSMAAAAQALGGNRAAPPQAPGSSESAQAPSAAPSHASGSAASPQASSAPAQPGIRPPVIPGVGGGDRRQAPFVPAASVRPEVPSASAAPAVVRPTERPGEHPGGLEQPGGIPGGGADDRSGESRATDSRSPGDDADGSPPYGGHAGATAVDRKQFERAQAERKQLEREQAQREQAEREQVEREQVERARSGQAQSERAQPEDVQSEREQFEGARSERAPFERARSEQSQAEQAQFEQSQAEQVQFGSAQSGRVQDRDDDRAQHDEAREDHPRDGQTPDSREHGDDEHGDEHGRAFGDRAHDDPRRTRTRTDPGQGRDGDDRAPGDGREDRDGDQPRTEARAAAGEARAGAAGGFSSGMSGGFGAYSAGQDEDDFVPANDTERDLFNAADDGSTDAFLSTLLLATVLVPVADTSRPGSSPGESGFVFRTEETDGERFLVVFTSRDRLAEHFAEPTRTVGVRFLDLIRNWPDPAWSFAVNPSTPVGARYPGAQVIALASWAAEAGLDPEERPAEAPAPVPQRVSDGSQLATVMQKTVPVEQLDYYLERGYDRVAGFVHRANEVEHLRTPAELFSALGLVHEGSPYQPDAKETFVLRWPAYRPSLYRIPYGGQSEQALRAMDGWVIERPPFRGNGFAPGEGRDVIAEFKVDSVRLPHGAQLWRLDADGSETMIAIFDGDAPVWRRVGER